MKWQYESGTPYYKFPSPCLPKKEFLESELDIDKSEAFSEEFFKKHGEMKCGIAFNVIELGLTVLLFILISVQKSVDLSHFKLTVGAQFEKKGKKKQY